MKRFHIDVYFPIFLSDFMSVGIRNLGVMFSLLSEIMDINRGRH